MLLLVALLSFVVVAALAALLLLHTSWGKARLCARLNRAISKQMAGNLQIGSIEEIDLPIVKGRDIKITPPHGKPAIDVAQADIELDLATLLLGDFAWKRADVRSGTVRVLENARGKTNMEETFAAPPSDSQKRRDADGGDGQLDLRTMVTSDMLLLIGGGDLPSLRLEKLHGIMRVQVDAQGETELRFDEYRGTFAKGLPNGVLQFRDVKGHVSTGKKRLLHFEGKGVFMREEVEFKLDIFNEPKTRVVIDALFPKVSAAQLSTLGLEVWSKVHPSLEVKVHRER